jgi:hypothetical protein
MNSITNIVICRENFMEINKIKRVLGKYFSNKPCIYDISCYQNVSSLIQDLENGMQCDLVFLDIYMNSTGINPIDTG